MHAIGDGRWNRQVDPLRGDAYIYALSDEAAYLRTDEDEKPAIVAAPPPDPTWFKCSFCRRSDRLRLFGAEYPVRNPNTFAVIAHICICGACVTRFAEQRVSRLHPRRP